MLYYGPDSFDQVNTGNYSLLQDFTAEATKIGFDLTQSSEAIGPASPQVNVVNTAELFFSTTDTETATLTFEYQGDTNVDVDTVVCRLRRVGTGDNPDVLDEIFTLAGMPSGSGSGTLPVELLAGERYQIFMDGRARSFNASSSTSSYVRLTITLPGCPADLADPIGTLNFFDLAAFIALYNAQDPAADLAEPMGTFNFFDVAAYLDAYNAGCP